MDYPKIIAALTAKKPFALARYGDGEFLCMKGTRGTNKDKHVFAGDLAVRLQESIAVPRKKITYALQNLVRRDRKLKAVLARHSQVKAWGDADTMHRQSWHRSIDDLFRLMKERQTGLVGPKRLDKITSLVKVRIPHINCWEQHAVTLEQMRKFHVPGMVWMICAGMSAPILIYDLVNELEDATLIDAGSIFDPYVGHCSRAYHRTVLQRLKRGGRGG